MTRFFSRIFGSEESEIEKRLNQEAREVRAFSDLQDSLNSVVSLTEQGRANLEAFEAYKAKITPKQ